MEHNSESFFYTYSAKQQEEVNRIRQRYIPPEENRMEQLRRLDATATRPGKIISILVGVISTLVLGFGMCCSMVWTQYFIPGIVIGLIGIAGIASAYPVYTETTKRHRKKLAPEILRLSQELMGQQ